MLVEYDQPDGKTVAEFIPIRDMVRERERDQMGRVMAYAYRGENALYNALVALTEGQVVYYVTQGHGEPPLMAAPGANMPNLSDLQTRLAGGKKLEVKPLILGRGKANVVPKDADAVIVAGPKRPFGKEAAQALSDYARRTKRGKKGKVTQTEGKLILLLDPVI